MKINDVLKVFGFVAVLLLIVWGSRSFWEVRPSDIRDLVISFGWWAPVVFIALLTFRPLVLFPTSIFSIAAGLAFGPYNGFIYIFIGAIGGASLAYVISSFLGMKFWRKPSPKMNSVREKMAENSFFYILILRLLPFLNFDLVSYLAGAGKVRYLPYIAATAVGIIPGTIGFVFFGSGLSGEDRVHLYVAVAMFILFSLLLFITRKKLKSWFGDSKDEK
ncbi:TVP38/TMEM64 family protein [Rossellomorea oryzaecorticis]|uniref:TVP38/TMEM64 family membrane protein n=1 Tax=Rossellomorea oryzaecorticis TaxID=1396505 RepID=A0ABW8VUQ0_9BACI